MDIAISLSDAGVVVSLCVVTYYYVHTDWLATRVSTWFLKNVLIFDGQRCKKCGCYICLIAVLTFGSWEFFSTYYALHRPQMALHQQPGSKNKWRKKKVLLMLLACLLACMHFFVAQKEFVYVVCMCVCACTNAPMFIGRNEDWRFRLRHKMQERNLGTHSLTPQPR